MDTIEKVLGYSELENLLVDSTDQEDVLWNQEDDLLAFLDPHF